MAFNPLQEIRETDTEVYYLLDTEDVITAEFLARYGTGTTNINFIMPQMKGYDDATGATQTLGVAPAKRTTKSSDTESILTASRQNERELAPITECDAFLINTGTAAVSARDDIAPCITGFQKAVSGMYKVGKALQDIAVGEKGFVRINVNDQELIS